MVFFGKRRLQGLRFCKNFSILTCCDGETGLGRCAFERGTICYQWGSNVYFFDAIPFKIHREGMRMDFELGGLSLVTRWAGWAHLHSQVGKARAEMHPVEIVITQNRSVTSWDPQSGWVVSFKLYLPFRFFWTRRKAIPIDHRVNCLE